MKLGIGQVSQQRDLFGALTVLENLKFILLDEPTTGQVRIYVERIKELMQRLKARNMTMLLVEQNASLAVRLSEYFCVLRNSRIVAEGRTTSLPEDVSGFFHKYYI